MEWEESLETHSLLEQSLERHREEDGAPKAELFAFVTFVEKYMAYLDSEPFKLPNYGYTTGHLKTYSMDKSYIRRSIVWLDGYNMIIEHRTRDKEQNADSLSKKTDVRGRLIGQRQKKRWFLIHG